MQEPLNSTEPPRKASGPNKQSGGDEPPFVEYEVDARAMKRYIDILFRKVKAEGSIKLSAFLENKDEKAKDKGKHVWVRLHKDGKKAIASAAIKLANEAANDDPPRVFCPPPVVFAKGKGAWLFAIQSAPALFADCDQHPAEAQRILEALLGPAHIVVYSGGDWQNEKTGEIEPKRHLYWILRKPAESPEDITKLGVAQKLAIALIDGDKSMTLVHPLRWPGAWHRKREPRLCTIAGWNGSADIDLDAALEILKKAIADNPEAEARLKKIKGKGTAKVNGKTDDPFSKEALLEDEEPDDRTAIERADEWGELIEAVYVGADYHDALNRLAMKYQFAGMDDRVVRNILDGLMRRTPEKDRDARWKARHADIERTISTGRAKVDAEAAWKVEEEEEEEEKEGKKKRGRGRGRGRGHRASASARRRSAAVCRYVNLGR
jgi:hypothetical protein